MPSSSSSSLVKNKQPAPIQITAEQLLREAHERSDLITTKSPLSITTTSEIVECEETRQFLRRQHEDKIKRFPHQPTNWIRYADWEENQFSVEDAAQPARVRSIYERSLSCNPRTISLWLAYAAFEARIGNRNCARNVFRRAIHLLPRCDLVWYKYVAFEEALGNVEEARAIWKQWISGGEQAFCPSAEVFLSFIKFERRQAASSSNIWEDRIKPIWIACLENHCQRCDLWMRFASEVPTVSSSGGDGDDGDGNACLLEKKAIFETAIASLKAHELEPNLICAYAKVLASLGEFSLAESTVKDALSKMSGAANDYDDDESGAEKKIQKLTRQWFRITKQFPIPLSTFEEAFLCHRIQHFEAKLLQETSSSLSDRVDIWIDYARMMQDFSPSPNSSLCQIRSIWERATSPEELPLKHMEKSHWKRHVWLWIYWAHFEEFQACDSQRASQVYLKVLGGDKNGVIPHEKFTFAKLWIHYARFLHRNPQISPDSSPLSASRKVFGKAIGICPKPKLFKEYCKFEMENSQESSSNDDQSRRIRMILQRWIETFPTSSEAWCHAASFEAFLGDWERARAIWEYAISSQPELDDAESVWKGYIEMECSISQWERARGLYERLLDGVTEHVKVWISFAAFEASCMIIDEEDKGEERISRVRAVFQRAIEHFAEPSEERLIVLAAWNEFELQINGECTDESRGLLEVQKLMPIRRKADGELEWPSSSREKDVVAVKKDVGKLLDLAHSWKREQMQEQ